MRILTVLRVSKFFLYVYSILGVITYNANKGFNSFTNVEANVLRAVVRDLIKKLLIVKFCVIIFFILIARNILTLNIKYRGV